VTADGFKTSGADVHLKFWCQDHSTSSSFSSFVSSAIDLLRPVMSAFDAITQSEALVSLMDGALVTGNTYSGQETHVQHVEDFRAGVTHIIACYHDLAVHARFSGIASYESLAEKAMTLGTALHTLTSMPSSLNLLLSLRDKDASEVLEAVQLARRLYTNMTSIFNHNR
jgi:hypothetical protein